MAPVLCLALPVALAHLAGFVIPRLRHPRIPCLLFHRIGPPVGRSDLWAVSRKRFVEIVEHIHRLGYRSLSLAELANVFDSGEMPPSPPYFFLTFDDGCRSDLETVGPILERLGWKATFFVTFEGDRNRHCLSRRELPLLLKTGSVQSHTRTFRSLLRIPGESDTAYRLRLRTDLVDYMSELEKLLGHRIIAMAYPGGEYDDTVVKAAASCYSLCFTTEYDTVGPDSNPSLLPRFMITGGTSLEDIDTFLYDGRDWLVLLALSECLFITASLAWLITRLRLRRSTAAA